MNSKSILKARQSFRLILAANFTTILLATSLVLPANAKPSEEEILSARESVEALAVALHAWNPSISEQEIARHLITRVEKVGIRDGLIAPAITLIDISYVAGVPRLSNLVLPTITRFAPELAVGIGAKLNIDPTFLPHDRAARGRIGLNQFRSDAHSILGVLKKTKPSSLDPSGMGMGMGMGQWNRGDKKAGLWDRQKSGDVISTMITGPGSYFQRKKVSVALGVPSEKGEHTKKPSRRGPISNMDAVAYVECAARCTQEVIHNGASGATSIGAVGALIGVTAGGPAGAGTGAAIGGGIGFGIGAALGINECRKSSECGGGSPELKESDDTPKPEPQKTPNPEPKKDEQPKTQSDDKSDDKDPKKKKDKRPKSGESGSNKGNSFPRRDDYQEGEIGDPVDSNEVRRQKYDPVVNPRRNHNDWPAAATADGDQIYDQLQAVIIYRPDREINPAHEVVSPAAILRETRDPLIFPMNPANSDQ